MAIRDMRPAWVGVLPAMFLAVAFSAGAVEKATAVTYGEPDCVDNASKRPGEGGNKGGAVNDESKLGVRWMATGTAATHFFGPNQHLLFGSQNPARDHEGSCSGDSGGPLFYDDGGREIQVAITSAGDAICRASSKMPRTDTPEILAFLGCVLAGTTTADIEACGCTEVGRRGECNA